MDNLLEKTLVIIVLYNCKPEDSDTFKTLCESAKNEKLHILLFNNSTEEITKVTEARMHRLYFINEPGNPGVSKAYNFGAKKAKELGLEWLLLADQDTYFPVDFFQVLKHSLCDYPNEKLFAPILESNHLILSPCRFAFNRGRYSKKVVVGLNHFKNKSLLNSGLLINVDAYTDVGGYNEKIRLDFSDFYFIHHFKKIYPNFVLTENHCRHDLSSNETDIEKLILRFNYYCQGAFEYGMSTNQYLNILFLTTVRTLKFTIKYRKASFIAILLQNIFPFSSTKRESHA